MNLNIFFITSVCVFATACTDAPEQTSTDSARDGLSGSANETSRSSQRESVGGLFGGPKTEIENIIKTIGDEEGDKLHMLITDPRTVTTDSSSGSTTLSGIEVHDCFKSEESDHELICEVSYERNIPGYAPQEIVKQEVVFLKDDSQGYVFNGRLP